MNNIIPKPMSINTEPYGLLIDTRVEIKTNDNFKKYIKNIPKNYNCPSNKIDLIACTKYTIFLSNINTKIFETGISINFDSDRYSCFAVCNKNLTINYNIVFSNGIINIEPCVEITLELKNNSDCYFVEPETKLGELILVPKVLFSKKLL